MQRIHNDLSLTSYALLALFVIAHEVLGLGTALVLGASMAGLWLAASLLLALADHWRGQASRLPDDPARMGGANRETSR